MNPARAIDAGCSIAILSGGFHEWIEGQGPAADRRAGRPRDGVAFSLRDFRAAAVSGRPVFGHHRAAGKPAAASPECEFSAGGRVCLRLHRARHRAYAPIPDAESGPGGHVRSGARARAGQRRRRRGEKQSCEGAGDQTVDETAPARHTIGCPIFPPNRLPDKISEASDTHTRVIEEVLSASILG